MKLVEHWPSAADGGMTTGEPLFGSEASGRCEPVSGASVFTLSETDSSNTSSDNGSVSSPLSMF